MASLLAAVAFAGALGVRVAPVAAQAPVLAVRGATASLSHGFPLAGRPLVVLIEGLAPRESFALRLLRATAAPPSVLAYLSDPSSPQAVGVQPGTTPDTLTSIWQADERGRVVLEIPLLDADDVDRPIVLQPMQFPQRLGEVLSLRVAAPSVLVATRDGSARVDLAHGLLRLPSLPDRGDLLDLLLSPDGMTARVLRADGRLETVATGDWASGPIAEEALEPGTDTLAGGAGAAAPFALARPSGQPFTPPARLRFLAGAGETLLLEPMGREVVGRRVAVSPDGLSAWVAEDDLLVRELDLATHATRGVFSAGLVGDAAVADLALDGRRLLVVTRGQGGRRGSLTTYDLDGSRLSTHPLEVDPLRLVVLGEGRALVVPADGRALQLLEGGRPGLLLATAGDVLDAAALPGGRFGPGAVPAAAVLLTRGPDGRRALELVDAAVGRVLQPGLDVPDATRLAGPGPDAPFGVVALLGAADGRVVLLRPETGELQPVEGLVARADEPFRTLP